MIVEKYINPHPPGCFWHETAEKWGHPNLKWCERAICSPISEPANAWSSAVLILFALAIFARSKNTGSRALKWIPWAFMLMGIASFFYHASNFYLSQALDFFGIFALLHWFGSINLLRARILTWKQAKAFYIGFLLLNMAFLHGLYLAHIRFQELAALAALLIVAGEYLAWRQNGLPSSMRWLIAALALAGTGQLFSLLDLTRVLCNPGNHFFQGHALWHILAGLGLFCLYRHLEQFKDDLP